MLAVLVEHLEYNQRSDEFAMYVLVIFGGVMLCPVICVVAVAGAPVDAKLFLAFAIALFKRSSIGSEERFSCLESWMRAAFAERPTIV